MASIDLQPPFRGIHGAFKDSAMVFFVKDKRQFGGGRPEKSKVTTNDQVKIRSYFRVASRAWKNLTQVQQQGWEAYAKEYYSISEAGHKITASGETTFFRANSIRQVLGLALVSAPPSLLDAPPEQPQEITQLTAQPNNTLGIEVVHPITTLTGLQLIVRATPAMINTSNAPVASDYRYVNQDWPQSAQALAASGDSYTFNPTRFSVENGQRYGVGVRIVRTADGIMSKPLYGDFIKSV